MATGPVWILCFDASTPRSAVALGRTSATRRHELVAFDEDEGGPRQPSSRLLTRLRAVARTAGIEPRQIGALACGRGPGMFTGTRVAVSTAKGIAVGLGLPLVGVSTLAALAMSTKKDGFVLPLLDARRSEVYGALYETDAARPSFRRRGEEWCQPLHDVVRTIGEMDLGDNVTAVGPGVAPYRDALPTAWAERAEPTRGPTAEGVFAASVAAYWAGHARPSAELQAVYLRKSYAELGINPPKRPFVKSPFV